VVLLWRVPVDSATLWVGGLGPRGLRLSEEENLLRKGVWVGGPWGFFHAKILSAKSPVAEACSFARFPVSATLSCPPYFSFCYPRCVSAASPEVPGPFSTSYLFESLQSVSFLRLPESLCQFPEGRLGPPSPLSYQ
jgi:hypothetical protein